MALANTAPVAPAKANPHGGIVASFDCPVILTSDDRIGFGVGFQSWQCW